MGIELPSELADVAAQAGVKWPEADEDKMRETAQVWRDTGAKLTALISDADGTARTALGTTSGESADAARKHWGTYVQSDTGKLTSMARGCTNAADQLDHAATQVADAKLAIVQNLIPLAKNKDVAEHAAAAGHPTALLGLDTAIKGTAANIANVHSTLVNAVQPVSGMTVDAVQPIVNPNPGSHGPGLVSNLVHGATQPVADLAQSATGGHGGQAGAGQGLLQPLADVAKPVTDAVAGGQGGQSGAGHGLLQPVADLAKPVTDVVAGGHGGQAGGGQGLLQPVADVAQPVVDGVAGPGDHGKGLVPGLVQPVADVAKPVVDGVAGPGGHGQQPGVVPGLVDGVVGGPGGHGGVVPGVVQPVVDTIGGGHGQPGGPEPVTGPIPVQDRPHVLPDVLPADAPTPPAGFQRPDHGVQAASASAVLDAPPAQSQPAQPAPVNQPAAPPAPAGGGQFASPTPPPPPAGAAVPPPAGAPGQQPVAAQPVQRGQAPVVMPEMARQAPAAMAGMAMQSPPPDAGGKQQERATVIAIWLVRMFPIGHMPVAADRPSRQLPPPSPEFDYAAGMRFEPNDHPESALIDDAEALAWALEGGDAVKPGEPQQHELAEGHDPLAGQNERDWERRFVVRAGSGRDTLDTEYAWPPSELFPEGATAPGEPEILEPGTLIDRFGTPEGRVFAAVDTTFTQRSLPPSHVNAEYRRYRVLKPLPVWRGISAAWFGQSGGGVRFRTTCPALDLIALGYVAEERDEG
jgi:hypothetical protein